MMEQRYPTLGLLASLALLTLVGCGSSDEPITTGFAKDINAEAVDESDPRAKLVLGQDVLRGRIYLENPRFRKVGAFTQTAVQVVNQSQDRFELEYRVTWFDDDDFEVESKAWRRFTLAGYEDKTIQASATRPEASKITLVVRFPDEIVQ
ncbi:MAG: DUF1425 domain-containing protein [Pseudomonadota bacterium]